MTTQKLQTKLRRHNLLQIGLGVMLGAVAPLLWLGSFWLARFLFAWPASTIGLQNAWHTGLYVAWGFVAILAFEGLRCSRPLFNPIEFSQSDFNILPPASGLFLRGNPDPFVYAWFLTQVWFLAPRTTVLAIHSFRDVIGCSPETIDTATAIFNTLKAERRWHLASDFDDGEPAIRLLGRLDLIWLRGGPSGMEVRFPAAMTEAELV
jgi:hypothetical protein